MASEFGFEVEAAQSKKGRIPPSNVSPYTGPWNPPSSNFNSSKPAPGWQPKASASPVFPTTSASSPAANIEHNRNWKAPESKALEREQDYLQNSLTEAIKRAAMAERKAADYLKAKDHAERQLADHRADKAALSVGNRRLMAENEDLKAENQDVKDAYQKLEKHTKNCEKATNKAQQVAKNARGNADHLINSQKGQLKSAERRYEEARRELKEWREKYGWSVDKPAEDKAVLEKRLSEWQSQAVKAQNEIVALNKMKKEKESLHGQHSSAEAEGNERRMKAEEMQSTTIIKAENDPSTTKAEDNRIVMIKAEEDASTLTRGAPGDQTQSSAAAEAKAAKYKEERDALHRMLQEEVGRNAKLAESLVMRNAKLAESMGWAAGEGEA
ncbi:MAG: hypothetical protein Q9161_001224 [Pseudevernia consocians]